MKTPQEWAGMLWSNEFTSRWAEGGSNTMKLVAEIIERAIREVLEVTPLEDPPVSEEDVHKWWSHIVDLDKRVSFTSEGWSFTSEGWNSVEKLYKYMLWQQSVIKFLAKENAYEEGVKVGERKGVEWVKSALARAYAHSATMEGIIDWIEKEYELEKTT